MNSYPYSFSTGFTNRAISGDFNGWSGDSNPLADADGDGVWRRYLCLWELLLTDQTGGNFVFLNC